LGVGHPFPISHEAAEPRHLALGVAARFSLGLGDAIFAARPAGEAGGKIAHTERPHRRGVGPEIEREEILHLLQGALFQHPIEARIDGGVNRLSLRGYDNSQSLRWIEYRRSVGALPLGERNTGSVDDL